MKYTSSEAAKLLRKLNEEHDTLEMTESTAGTFIVAAGEDVESLRPEYDYERTQEELRAIEEKIVKIKHALNVFNASNKLPGYDITVDQALVIMPQLTRRRNRLDTMRRRLPKTRETMRSGNIIDYCLTNYDPKQAQKDFEKASEELAALQTALDLFNTTVSFEIYL
ncbi:MAG: hypothetical protein J5950_10815 [Clostridia bacterium]|nr:hypothetical protein [Clostridia bacterium]